MSWYCVYIPSQPSSTVSAKTLAEIVRERYERSGKPQDVKVYHAFTEDWHHLFYFSPACQPIFGDLLRFFEATPRDKPPFVETLTPIVGSNAPPIDEWWESNNKPQNANGSNETDETAGSQ